MKEENINREAIKKTIQSLKSEKDLIFRMDTYKTACGTAGCIAGHVLHSNNPGKYISLDFEAHWDIHEAARRMLNISDEAADKLFVPAHKYADAQVTDPDDDTFVGKYRAIKALEMIHDDEILDWSKIPTERELVKNEKVKGL